MSDDVLTTLVPALGIAAFERRPDGSFGPVAPLPSWFARLLGDGTFPFLGHILDEAVRYWNKDVAKPREWGPVAEVDEAGKAFHYKVTAITVAGRQFLLFQTDAASDRMQHVLQKVRSEALVAEQRAGSGAVAVKDMQKAVEEFRALLQQWPDAASNEPLRELRTTLSARSDDLLARLDAFIRQSTAS